MIYGYVRVSTKGQARDGNSLEAQTHALIEAGATKIYSDSFTGTKMDRPEFDKLKSKLLPGDTLIATKLDRFARSASQGSQMIEALIADGITVHILNLGVMNNTPTGKLIRNVMLSFAEFERDMIVERTQEGKVIAREKGVRVDGRPKKDIPEDVFKKFLKKQKDGELTVNDCCKQLGICRATWYNLARERLIWDNLITLRIPRLSEKHKKSLINFVAKGNLTISRLNLLERSSNRKKCLNTVNGLKYKPLTGFLLLC